VAISKFRGKGQIPWLGSKFRGPQKTGGPTDYSINQLGGFERVS